MAKMGFYFDQKKCVGCRTCQTACKDKNDLEVGDLFRHVTTYQQGTYPSAILYHHAATCNHCEKPACVAGCPNGAMYIDDEDGTVQHDDSKCIGCQYCVEACPYGVPVHIESIGLTHKCDACKQLRDNGEEPACVAGCPMRALEFGPIEELAAAHPDAVRDLPILPSSEDTAPCTLIDAKAAALESDFEHVII